MVSKMLHDPRQWRSFWSTIVRGTRYRHQVRLCRVTGRWLVRTEVWEEDDAEPYYTASQEVPAKHGDHMFRTMHRLWSNIDPVDGPMYPPEYSMGFSDLEE